MKKHSPLYPSLFAGLLIVFFNSCGENNALKEETIYFQEENKGWISDDSAGINFVMIDNNSLSQSFAMNDEVYEFSKSWGGFLGINTLMTHTEYHYKSYSSSFGDYYSVSLTAGHEPYGDDLYIDLTGMAFSYDLKFETVSRLYLDLHSKSMLMTDKGYEQQGEEIYSTVSLVDSFRTLYHQYDSVLIFELKDFESSVNDFTPVKIFYAKNTGLIRYDLKNGVYYERK
jgi:hypothetical protein